MQLHKAISSVSGWLDCIREEAHGTTESDERGDTVNYRGEKKLMQLIYVRRSVLAVTISILLICLPMYSGEQNSSKTNALPQAFLGRWDLTLKTPTREAPSWLEITEDNGQFRARMVSRWGHELITNAKFQDFKLHIEFNCARGSNSGVYLRGRYELQIEDDPEPEGPTMRTGGIYGFLAPSPEQPRRPGEWQSYDIILIGRVVTVVLNGQTIIDSKEIPGITGGALDSHEGEPGPIYLQGSEAGHVAFRNITITPAK